ncbi:Ig-like domain-containing protein [Enterobacter hormaechei]
MTIYDNGIAIGTAIVGSNGSWSFTPSVNLSEGSDQLTVRATDVAGNTGPASPVFTVTVDVTAPQTPSGFIINDDTGVLKGAIGAGQFTDASEPRLTGRGEPGSTITVYDNGVLSAPPPFCQRHLEHHADESTGRRRTLDYPAGNRCGRQPERSVSAIQLYRRFTPPDMPVATLNSAGTELPVPPSRAVKSSSPTMPGCKSGPPLPTATATMSST